MATLGEFTRKIDILDERAAVANPGAFDAAKRQSLKDILARKAARYAVAGNSWQNVFPKHIRAYQDWWSRLQAA